MASSYFSIAAILILILFTTHLNFCIAARKILSSETDTEFIKTSCGATSYPDLCFTTFSSYASEIQASPKILASKSLSLTLNTTLSASKFLTELSKSQDLEPREAAALQDCVEEISDSVDELKRSIGEMDEIEGKSFAFRMSDIETWVSAALTDEDTCTDGFSENATDGDVKATVRSQIEKVAHMTSIALAFVNCYAGTKN
ncbi:Pectinesterase inhibitor domain - like 10 [Theobroma cacao]|nr:Pectinesterase inhibitor domain - like 10 [Theobroma cacao]